MEREYSTSGEPESCKKRRKKLSEATVYNTKLYSKWCSKNPMKASSSQTHFVCVVCSREFSCAHHGEADTCIKWQCDKTKSDTMR
jgi:hypothetical protein